MADQNYPVTTKELVDMLGRWNQDQEFDVRVHNNPDKDGPSPIVILAQQTNTIRLN